MRVDYGRNEGKNCSIFIVAYVLGNFFDHFIDVFNVKVRGEVDVDGCLADLGEDLEGEDPLLFLKGDENQGEEYVEDSF